MNIAAEINALKTRRVEHVVAIEQIDAELIAIQKALGLPPTAAETVRSAWQRHRPAHRRDRTSVAAERGQTWTSILDALAVREPQTVVMLRESVNATTVNVRVKEMADAGALVRALVHTDDEISRRPPYWYARSQAVLDAFIAEQASPEVDGDGDPFIESSDAGGSSSATATTGIRRMLTSLPQPSAPLSMSSGSIVSCPSNPTGAMDDTTPSPLSAGGGSSV